MRRPLRPQFNLRINSVTTSFLLGLVSGIATVILSDPDKRDKVAKNSKDILNQTGSSAISIVDTLTDKISENNDKIHHSIAQITKKLDAEIAKVENKNQSDEDIL